MMLEIEELKQLYPVGTVFESTATGNKFTIAASHNFTKHTSNVTVETVEKNEAGTRFASISSNSQPRPTIIKLGEQPVNAYPIF